MESVSSVTPMVITTHLELVMCKVDITSDLIGGPTKTNLVKSFKYYWICLYAKSEGSFGVRADSTLSTQGIYTN